MKRAVGRGPCAAAFPVVALLAAFAAAPAAAQNSCTTCLLRPLVTSTPASGSTYYPGEIITVQVRPRNSPWVSMTSADSPTLVLRVGSSDETLSGSLQSRQYSYTVYDHEQRQDVTRSRDTNVLEFSYTVQKGDRDTDGVSVAANALGGGNIGANVGGSSFGGGTWHPNLSKNHSAMSAQAGHKVDTPAPSWSGVTGPDIIFYAGGTVSYRLPQVANADAAHNVSYSVTSARPLPTGYALNASTGTITGSYGSALARQSYTLRATDGFNRTADLTFHLQVSAEAGIESISITSNPGADKTYGKVAPFGTNDTITVRVDITHRLTTVLPSSVCLDIRIGSNTRGVCNPSYSTSDSSRWDKLDFSYAVQAGDWDGDGISFLTNPMGAGKIGGLRFRLTGGGTDNRVNRNFASIPADPNHKVRGQQTVPSFGSTAGPAYSWVKDNAVSQALPAATGGDGGVTYSIEESLPAGLSFAAATRTISGTPTAAQAAANYTLAATDADGDKATLRFSIGIAGITVSIDSPSVTEGDSGSKNLTFTATLSTASAQQVTVQYADAGTGTATSGTDYTAITGGTLTFTAGTTSQTFNVSVTGDTTDEVDETILVTLSNASGATISTATGTGTITDNDDPPTVSVAAASVTEGDSGSTNLTFTATLSAASGKQVTVTWAEGTGGTATSGTDYTAITGGTLTFAAGTTSQTFNVSVTGDVVDESNETVVVTLSSPTNATISATAGSATGTITDNDATPTSITLTVNDDSVDEGDGDTTITVTATVDGATRFGTARTVSVSVAGSGTASAVDFAAVSDFNITIAAGAASKSETFTLSPTDDSVDETDETITVSGTSTGLTVNQDTITLSDDDATPSITLSVDDSSVAEDDGATTITVTATVDGTTRFVDDTTVEVSVAGSGTATAVDFAAVSNFNISIAAEAASGTETFTLTPTDDAVDETNETVTVSGTSGSLTVNSDTITLTDDDDAPTAITLTVNDNSVAEDDGATTITVTATVDGTTRFAAATTVTVSVAGSGTATAVDFAAVSDFNISIAAEAQSKTGTFTLTPTNDVVDETNETVTVSGTSGSLTVNSATITLTDDDAAPTAISLTVNDNSVGEGDGATTITVTATVDGATRFAAATTVTVSVAGSGTATAVDFAAVSDFNISIAAEAASANETFTLTPTNDVVDETTETVTVSGESGSLTVNSATISLTDDDAAPTSITLTVNDNSVAEDDGATTITVTATVDGASRFVDATTVTVSVSGSGTATAVDFGAVADFDVTIAAGAASANNTFTLTPTNDAVDETNETVTVSGTSGSLTVNSATITLTDDDDAPTAITLTVNDNSVGEGDGATTITVTATVDGTTRFAAATTVTVSVAGSGTATAVDFGAVADFDVTIAAEAASANDTFTLTPTDDAVDETNETVTVSGESGSLTVNSATITLTDDDDAPTAITLTVNDNSVGEGDGATTITVTATVDGTTRFAAATTVTVSVSDSGTATAVDFASVSDFDVTIAAGAASANNAFTLTPTNDAVDETDETVTVSGESGSLTVNSATITVTDDDAAPTSITLTVNDDSVAEDDGATTITVTATVDGTTRFATATTVTVSVAGSGTATAVDFASVSDFDVTIAAEAASANDTFTLTPADDALDEADETITVSGASGSLTVNSDTITLADDDATPSLSIDSPTVAEGNAGSKDMTFTVTLSAASGQQATVDYAVDATNPGTATSGTDYAPVSAGTLTFATGATSETIAVSVTGDTTMEPDETVRLTLSAPANATLATATGVGTIVSDDGVSLLRIDADPTTPNADPGPLALNELSTDPANSKSYSVRPKTPPTQAVTVTITSGDAGAVTVGDTDSGTPGTQNTLTFTAMNWSAARTVTLTAAQDDDGVDDSVAVTHAASTASNSEYTGDSASLTATVDDDETPAVVIDANPSTANVADAGPLRLTEGHATDAAKTYSVRLATEPTQTVTVTLTSADMGAVSIDENTLTFTDTTWETAQTVTARAADDDDAGNESAALRAAASTATASEYTGVAASLTAMVDDDETRAMTLSASTLTVPENSSATYTVLLTAQPVGGNVTVTITGAGSGITTSPTALTFTPSNWSAAQTVTVSAAPDANGLHESVTLTHTASGADYDSGVATVEIVATATDDDGPSLQVRPNTLTVREESSASYQVRLNTEPSANVTVTVGGATSEVTVDTDADTTGNQSALTFTPTDWSTYQDVKVSADDDDDATDEMLTLGHTAAGATEYAGLPAGARPGVAVTVDDDDTRAIVIDADPTTLNVADSGPLALNEQSGHAANAKSYSVRLATQPTAAVSVAVASDDRAVSVDTDSTPQTRTLAFTTTNWSTPQTVTATAAEDDDASDERVTITHAASGGDYEDVTASLAAQTTDDDEPAIMVLASTLTASGVDEGGAATYSVRLATEPEGAVTVAVAASGGVSVDLNDAQAGEQPSLHFDATSWNAARTAVVRGLPDADAANGTATLRHSASGADYRGVSAAAVSFAVTDDDARGVLVAPTALTVNEGSTGAYTVVLATAPVGSAVAVAATSSDTTAATVSPASLTFTASNWNVPQTFQARGASDTDSTDGSATISHAVSGGDYGAVPANSVAVAVRDAQAAGVRIEPPRLTLREGATGAYRVRLNTQPAGDVEVTATSPDAVLEVDADATPLTRTLTFTTQNWNVEQAVSASAGSDDNAADETLSVSHAVSGYAGVPSAPALAVTVEDDDAAGFSFTPAEGLSLTEGGGAEATATYAVALTAQPSGTVTVALSSNDAGLEFDANAAPGDQASLTFDAANWNAAQTVTARAAADADAATEEATLLHSAAGGGYDGVLAGYAVRLSDADAAPAPTGVSAEAAGPTSLMVRWNPSAEAQGHAVQWRRAGQAWSASRQMTLPAGSTSARIDGLATGAEYIVRVLGMKGGDPGEPSDEARATPADVVGGNRRPQVVELPEDIELEIGGAAEVLLARVFLDPDGDALFYTAVSAAPGVASATVSGSVLRVEGLRPGIAEIALTATDPDSLSARAVLRTEVLGRACQTGPAQAPEGGAARVVAELSSVTADGETVRWRVVADRDRATADADAGEHGDASGEATIPAGERCAAIEIAIADDADVEPAREWFAVELELRQPHARSARLRRSRIPVAVLEGVCDRTPAVRDALLAAAAAGTGCERPAPADLTPIQTLALDGAEPAAMLATGDLSGLPGLRTLDLRGNALTGLAAGVVEDVPRLERLLLGGNALPAVPRAALRALPRLRDLDLSDNALRTLPDAAFAGLSSLRLLRLDGNPGAPFALTVALRRVNGEPWAPPPARIRARAPAGAPFDLALSLTAQGGRFSNRSATAETLVRAGATAGGQLVVQADGEFAVVSVSVPDLPAQRCQGGPCWRGFELVAGDPLTLFARPPRALTTPEPEALFGDALRLRLASLAAPGDAGGELAWRVSSSDPAVAAVRIVDGTLVVEPQPGAEGTVLVEATATDANGLSTTIRFEVQVDFHWPSGRSWRNALPLE